MKMDAVRTNRALLLKVPEVTIFFWIVKLLTTAMGESTSDYMVHQMDPVIAVLIGAAAFAVAIVLQFWVRRYIAWVYWLAVVMVAVFGTMAADVVHIVLGVPYVISAICFAVGLTVVFVVWYRVEGTLSIHSIDRTRREFFYWCAVLATFAMGTALGDLTAITLHLGYFPSAVLFAVLIALPAIGYRFFGLNPILGFWFAYVVTRPLGASFADWFGRSPALGGIGVGQARTALGLTVVIVLFVAYLAVSRVDAPDRAAGRAAGAAPRR